MHNQASPSDDDENSTRRAFDFLLGATGCSSLSSPPICMMIIIIEVLRNLQKGGHRARVLVRLQALERPAIANDGNLHQ